MKHIRELLQKNAESPVWVARPARVLLGALLVIGGSALSLLLCALLVKGLIGLDAPDSAGPGWVIALLPGVVIGLAIAFVGVRLIALKRDGEYLLGASATRVASYFVAVCGCAILVVAIAASSLTFVANGLVALAVARWLYVSGNRRT
jgi:hypothetical protein